MNSKLDKISEAIEEYIEERLNELLEEKVEEKTEEKIEEKVNDLDISDRVNDSIDEWFQNNNVDADDINGLKEYIENTIDDYFDDTFNDYRHDIGTLQDEVKHLQEVDSAEEAIKKYLASKEGKALMIQEIMTALASFLSKIIQSFGQVAVILTPQETTQSPLSNSSKDSPETTWKGEA